MLGKNPEVKLQTNIEPGSSQGVAHVFSFQFNICCLDIKMIPA